MHTSFLVLIILALVIVASIITSIVTYLILAGRNKRIRLAEQYRQIRITDGYLSIQEEIEKKLSNRNTLSLTVSPVKLRILRMKNIQNRNPIQKIFWVVVRGKIVIHPKRSLNTGIFIYQGFQMDL